MNFFTDRVASRVQSAQRMPLVRVICVVLFSIGIVDFSARFMISVLRGPLRVEDPARWSLLVYYSPSLQLLLFLVIAAASISLFIKSKPLWRWPTIPTACPIGRTRTFGLGIFGACLALILAAPLPTPRQTGGIISISLELSSMLASRYTLLLLIPIVLFLAGACAICLEVFIRGVVFKCFASRFNLLIGIAVSCLVSYFFWPLGSPLYGVVIALISSLLYYRTRVLGPSIVACMSFLCAIGPVSLLFHKMAQNYW